MVTFPASAERDTILDWLQGATGVAAEQVVAISSSTVTSIASAQPTTDPPGQRLALRAQALSREIYGRGGILAWDVTVETDCPGRKIRTGPTVGHFTRQASGEGALIQPEDPRWRPPPAGTTLESAWRFACERNFQPQLLRAQRLGAPSEVPRAVAVAEASSPALSREAAPRPVDLPKPAPAPIAPGATAVRVQVVAAATETEARAALVRFRSRHPEHAAGLPAEIVKATIGPRTVYRVLVTGFSGGAAASRWCGALKAAGHDCFLRRAR